MCRGGTLSEGRKYGTITTGMDLEELFRRFACFSADRRSLIARGVIMSRFKFCVIRSFAIALATIFFSVIFSQLTMAQDTTFVYGGPGSLDGKFETAAGLPDRQGWVGMDLTAQEPDSWQTSTFNCANLDPGQVDNHAWWCGDILTACSPDDPPEGYRNDRNDWLEWFGAVPDSNLPTTVTIKAVLNHDTETGYDYLYLRHGNESGAVTLEQYTGQADSVVVDVSVLLTPGSYYSHPSTGVPAVYLRWEFRSDGGWSDEDCEYPTAAGAAQIDRIEVWFDQGGGSQQIGATETCEPSDPAQWALGTSGVGDFSKVWPLLDDIDPDVQNDTPQFAFLDDGIVVFGTGGTYCGQPNNCYGPNEWVVNYLGGLAGSRRYLQNEIWSPPIAIPEQPFDYINLAFSEYDHNGRGWPSNRIYSIWRVRSTADPAGLTGWSEWRNHGELWAGSGVYRQRLEVLTDLLVPDSRMVQLALGIEQHNQFWGQHFGTPGPYYDNVSLYLVNGVSDVPDLAATLRLDQPVPNPFNPSTTVSFALPADGPVSLAVYDLRGRLVRRLVDEFRIAGSHFFEWDGTDNRGVEAAAGTYVFRLKAGGEILTAKGSLLK